MSVFRFQQLKNFVINLSFLVSACMVRILCEKLLKQTRGYNRVHLNFIVGTDFEDKDGEGEDRWVVKKKFSRIARCVIIAAAPR